MGRLCVEVHDGLVLFNSLDADPDPDRLMQDLLGVERTDGTFIDVGWYPQFDPAGRYRVSILDAEGSVLETVAETRDVREVLTVVEAHTRGSIPSRESIAAPSSPSR